LGGILSDRYGYSFTFLITAGIQLLGTSLQLLLIPLVPINERSEPSPDSTTDPPRRRASPDVESLQPLDAAQVHPGRYASAPEGQPGDRLILRESISSECE
jgi:hypothetical protein